jgi:hypothetical protein
LPEDPQAAINAAQHTAASVIDRPLPGLFGTVLLAALCMSW